MVDEQLEVEDKYDVSEDFVLPDLTDDRSVERVETTAYALDATYFDTPEGDLRRLGITLRRRKGGRDAGWHLKLPAESGRTQMHVASRSAAVPRELSALLLGVRRGRTLAPAVTLSTTRDSHVLTDAAGQVLAEVADDHVHVTTVDGSPGITDWREIEVELGPAGAEELLSSLGRRLVNAGAERSASGSKSGRALGEAPYSVPHHERLAGLVDDYLQAQYATILDGDLALRRELNAVHSTRVAVRRLRSTARTFGKLFDPDAADRLESELVWYAALLGDVRDLDILRDRLTERVAAVPAEFVLGPVAGRVESTLASDRAAAYRRLRQTINGRRYAALLALLEQWRVDPPYTAAAGKSKKAAAGFVAKAEKKMRKRLRRAVQPGAVDTELHRARKSEKRYRYAGELAQSVLGNRNEQAIKDAKALQKLLGEFQDSVVSAATLRRLGVTAGETDGENGFTYGVLLAQEWQIRRSVRADVLHDYG